jgi:sulfhydrogenase subunit beta (sulfur reductase)
MTGDAAVSPVVLTQEGLDRLIEVLAAQGYEVAGPVRRDGAVVYGEVFSSTDLPRGWIDVQEGGSYRLKREGDAFFGYTVGPDSLKRFLHPPKQELWRAHLDGDAPRIVPEPVARGRHAFIGVRACELAAIQVQDKVFLDGPFRDPHYAARRENLFMVTVNCGRAGATCFCSSMGAGPKAGQGYDISLTEIGDGFLAETGSEAGAALLADLPSRPAQAADLEAAQAAIANAEAGMGRKLDTEGLPELMTRNHSHPRWDEVAKRCLNCANCTMVCPTCFCTTVDEVSDLEGREAARVQRWASCFTTEFSYVHGGPVRAGAASRYRHWISHKLSTWHEQFGTSGCTGCGRCITWCPVGIDITEEVAAIRGVDLEGADGG